MFVSFGCKLSTTIVCDHYDSRFFHTIFNHWNTFPLPSSSVVGKTMYQNRGTVQGIGPVLIRIYLWLWRDRCSLRVRLCQGGQISIAGGGAVWACVYVVCNIRRALWTKLCMSAPEFRGVEFTCVMLHAWKWSPLEARRTTLTPEARTHILP